MVPPRPVAFGVWSSTPAIKSPERMSSATTRKGWICFMFFGPGEILPARPGSRPLGGYPPNFSFTAAQLMVLNHAAT